MIKCPGRFWDRGPAKISKHTLIFQALSKGLLEFTDLRPRPWGKSVPFAFICMGWTYTGLLASKPSVNQPDSSQYVSAEFTGRCVSVCPADTKQEDRNPCRGCLLPSPLQLPRAGSLFRFVSPIPYWFWETEDMDPQVSAIQVDILINGSDGTNTKACNTAGSQGLRTKDIFK